MISQLWICCPALKTCFVSNYKAVSLFCTVFKSHDIYLTLMTISIEEKVKLHHGNSKHQDPSSVNLSLIPSSKRLLLTI